jgi:hypothetical protein
MSTDSATDVHNFGDDKRSQRGIDSERSRVPTLFDLCQSFYTSALESPRSYRGSQELTLEIFAQVNLLLIDELMLNIDNSLCCIQYCI